MKAFLRINNIMVRMLLESNGIPLSKDCLNAKWLCWNGHSVHGLGETDDDIPPEQAIQQFITENKKTKEYADCGKCEWTFYKAIKDLNYDDTDKEDNLPIRTAEGNTQE